MPASRTPHFQCLERSSAYRYHPIHNVPFEVLAIILHWAMREDVHIPATALQVSRLWRYISVHSPQLWSRLALTPNWELWQSRIVLARASQLEVELRSDAQRGQSLTAASAQYAMHVALPYIHRWRSLDINLKDYSPYLLASTISGCCSLGHTTAAPQLEELSLHYPLNDDPKEFALFSGYAPRLHRLSVSGMRLVWSSSLYANLTYLDYTHHPFTNGRSAVAEVLHMLRSPRS
ncbi:hypothetical protein DL96DRAFT_157989 [Flagelloscypha sp. PMI_526]|nr:hypothetical protein DL96DRAFT_157989 [Flagelloscypha sp. PMI_526]